MTRVSVLHMIDTLDPGGAERAAVNLVNHLPVDRYEVSLCTTRRDGPLDKMVAPHVSRLRLSRSWFLDPAAIWQMRSFLCCHSVRLLHAHSSSVFLARLVSTLTPGVRLLWHDHCGSLYRGRPAWLYKLATHNADGIISVSEELAAWSRQHLKVATSHLWYVPNLVSLSDGAMPAHNLPGRDGLRLVCVAHLRPQKDHFNLLQALAALKAKIPEVHLLLLGGGDDTAYSEAVRREALRLRLEGNVTFLGVRDDVAGILRACDVGVLSSRSEGMPLALLEYGAAGLAAVATITGQNEEILDYGRAGVLVPPSSPQSLCQALCELLDAPQRRRELGERLRSRVQERYSPDSIISRIVGIYDAVLEDN